MTDKPQKISLVSLGCAKNLVDSEVLLGGLKKADFCIVEEPDDADTVIINTCGFLESAREESVEVILEAGALKTEGKINKLVVMGCFSQRYGTELRKELPEVDEFFGTHDHAKILSYLTGKPHVKADPDYYRSLLTPRHYAYLKITEGCDNGCSFCSIPLMRGLQVSQPLEWCVREAERLVQSGVKEILVIGQDTTSYGWDLSPRLGLQHVLEALDRIDGLEWLRLHYAHPAHLHREVIRQFGRLERLVPYVDMPVQHASDKILKSMRRGLGREGILKRIDALRDVNPEIVLRTSVIVGYPGETEEDFNLLRKFVEEVRFDRLGVFTYSEEEGTKAVDYRDDVPKQVKFDRMDEIMLLQQEISLQKNEGLIGATEKILIDAHTADGNSVGRTFRDSPEVDNIVAVGGEHPVGEFINVKFTEAGEYELVGEAV
ncbi:MAG: 30S ribosomal protein S12 methylthiotransferase RimO [FCB group bacterium]|nr:30S ribosomal protein S12 methylthiotransferase RimO [FCB group bacterium]